MASGQTDCSSEYWFAFSFNLTDFRYSHQLLCSWHPNKPQTWPQWSITEWSATCQSKSSTNPCVSLSDVALISGRGWSIPGFIQFRFISICALISGQSDWWIGISTQPSSITQRNGGHSHDVTVPVNHRYVRHSLHTSVVGFLCSIFPWTCTCAIYWFSFRFSLTQI